MSYYRSQPLDLSTRLSLATEMLLPLPERPWGRVTHLSHQYGVSRTWLYELRHRAFEAISDALHPRPPGPRPQEETLRLDRSFVQRAITILPLLKGSVRGIQEGLDLLFGVHRSVGHISETLQQVGHVATEMNAAVTIPLPVLGEADEIFQGKSPCLTVVDGRSFVVLNLTAAQTRDANSWGVTFLELRQQGVKFHDLERILSIGLIESFFRWRTGHHVGGQGGTTSHSPAIGPLSPVTRRAEDPSEVGTKGVSCH